MRKFIPLLCCLWAGCEVVDLPYDGAIFVQEYTSVKNLPSGGTVRMISTYKEFYLSKDVLSNTFSISVANQTAKYLDEIKIVIYLETEEGVFIYPQVFQNVEAGKRIDLEPAFTGLKKRPEEKDIHIQVIGLIANGILFGTSFTGSYSGHYQVFTLNGTDTIAANAFVITGGIDVENQLELYTLANTLDYIKGNLSPQGIFNGTVLWAENSSPVPVISPGQSPWSLATNGIISGRINGVNTVDSLVATVHLTKI